MVSDTNKRLVARLLFHGIFFLFLSCRACFAHEDGSFKLGGYYLGLLNAFHQDNRTAADAKRSQFDFAVSFEGEWSISPKVSGAVELQGGPGGGNLGFAGPNVVVADLNLAIMPREDFTLTIGSFNNPFGEEVDTVTSNAVSFDNPFVLNSLFYSAFGGTVGSLNTVGVKGNYKTASGNFMLAITNGTDESSANPDGNFEYALSAGTSALAEGLHLSGTYIKSDDIEPSGASGFGADFKGWVLESRYEFKEGSYIKGYYGSAAYGDENDATKDDVKFWMGEARYTKEPWYISLRLSGWNPDDDNGDGAGVSSALPNPGLAVTQGIVTPVTDQKVTRLQFGAGWALLDNLMLKAEWFQDKYERQSAGNSTDVDGFLFAINGKF